MLASGMTASSDAEREAQTTMRKLQHDLRTPIGQILGYGEMLQEELDDRELVELLPDLEHIRSAATTLLDLVDGIFRPGEARRGPAQLSGVLGASGSNHEPVSAGGSGRVLVVDDEPGNRELLGRWLVRAGFEVAEAGSGQEALVMVDEQSFDLVPLDVMMPDMDGMATLESIRRRRSVSELPVIMATALTGNDDMVAALDLGANDYVTKPFDRAVVVARVRTQATLRASAREIEMLAQQLEIRNAFLRQTFGRYLSDEVVSALLESEKGLDISGERRRITVLLTDLRGFTSLTESLAPTGIVSILNNYLATMSAVVHDYGGTVDEFLGDAILAHFGALTTRADDAERAVACAIAMQRAIADVNELNRSRGLPGVEMGIGLATGDVIVGNVGSEKRSKHTAIGSAVNLASRIEGYTLGGEILASEATIEEVAGLVSVDRVREVWPKGFDEPTRVHRVVAIGGRHNLALPVDRSQFVELDEAIRVRFAVLEGKSISSHFHDGEISALSSTGARLRSSAGVRELADHRIEFGGIEPGDGACYAKVVDAGGSDASHIAVRFSTRSAELDRRVSIAQPRADPPTS